LVGIDGIICEVEVDVARGGFEKSLIVGLCQKRNYQLRLQVSEDPITGKFGSG
jgi:hypothetical protein